MLTSLSAHLGGQVSICATWIWSTVAEDGLKPETETGRFLPKVSRHDPLSSRVVVLSVFSGLSVLQGC